MSAKGGEVVSTIAVVTAVITLEVTVSRRDISGLKVDDVVGKEREQCSKQLQKVLEVLGDEDICVATSSMRTEITIAEETP